MSKELIIKGFTIGKGKPLVCVPIMASEKDAIVVEAQKYVDAGVPMIEWRVDAFAQGSNLEAIQAVLDELKPVMEHTILVFTYRTKGQGGNGTADKQSQYYIHEVAAKSGVVDFVDVEYFELDKPTKGIRELKKHGVYIIASHHDFNETPDSGIISMILGGMYDSGADVVKLALMPNSLDDVYSLMIETSNFRKEYPEMPVITMSMGALGSLTRVAGQYFGSCVTFGAGEVASAPGQLEFGELGQILNILDNCINK